MEVEKLSQGHYETNTKTRPFIEDLKRVNGIALPMIVTTVSQFLLRTSPMFMLGHVNELYLSSASIATSICNVTGFSVVFGMASALETLCGQSYGAQQYQKVGAYLNGAILCQFLVCIPISVLWIFTEKLLIITGQDPLISAQAGKFAVQLIPSLFAASIFQCASCYLQTQSLITPMALTTLASLFLQLVLCWAFVFKLDLGNAGATLSIGISYWFSAVLVLIYIRYSPACEKTRAAVVFSRDVFSTVKEFFRFAVPSSAMVCLEWWSFELILLLSGLLPNPRIETSVISICFTVSYLHYHIPYSYGAAASTLISNELGAGKPGAAKRALNSVLALSITELLIASIAILSCSHVLGYAFTENRELVRYVKEMAPFLSLSIVMDSTQAVLSGVARGSGWQHIGAYVNLGAYYVVGTPVAVLLAFVFGFKAKGLWSGLLSGATVQSIGLWIVTCLTNWDKQATEARRRIFSVELAFTNIESVEEKELLI